jgi:hypothetical protein
MVIPNRDMVTRNGDMVTRNGDMVARNSDIAARNSDMVVSSVDLTALFATNNDSQPVFCHFPAENPFKKIASDLEL